MRSENGAVQSVGERYSKWKANTKIAVTGITFVAVEVIGGAVQSVAEEIQHRLKRPSTPPDISSTPKEK